MRATFNEERMQALATRLETDERVLARGRAYESLHQKIQDLGIVNGPGCAVIVTDRRLLWTDTSDLSWMRTLLFESVVSYRELFQAHRYALVIDHGAIAALHRVPVHRVLGWSWGNAVAIESQTMTTLAFSRETTDVAKTIKARLKSLGSIADAPRTLPHARDDGSARAYLMLSPHPHGRP